MSDDSVASVARRIGVGAGIVFGDLLARVFPAADCQVAAAELTRGRMSANALAAQEMFPQYTKTSAPTDFPTAGSADEAQTAGVAPRDGGPAAGAAASPAAGHRGDRPTSELLYEAAGALHVLRDRHKDVPKLITELQDRGALLLRHET